MPGLVILGIFHIALTTDCASSRPVTMVQLRDRTGQPGKYFEEPLSSADDNAIRKRRKSRKQKKKSPFLALPPEIRKIVYDHLIESWDGYMANLEVYGVSEMREESESERFWRMFDTECTKNAAGKCVENPVYRLGSPFKRRTYEDNIYPLLLTCSTTNRELKPLLATQPVMLMVGYIGRGHAVFREKDPEVGPLPQPCSHMRSTNRLASQVAATHINGFASKLARITVSWFETRGWFSGFAKSQLSAWAQMESDFPSLKEFIIYGYTIDKKPFGDLPALEDDTSDEEKAAARDMARGKVVDRFLENSEIFCVQYGSTLNSPERKIPIIFQKYSFSNEVRSSPH